MAKVSFDIDANGILQVSASDKASGKTSKVTITSDKGRLSEEEIARMLAEAEENAESDKEMKQKVEAKNQLEAYLYSLRSSVTDALKDKLEDSDKELLTNTVNEALGWLEENPDEGKDTYDEKRGEVEGIANPIISKAYTPPQEGGGAPGESNAEDGGSEPTVEEVD